MPAAKLDERLVTLCMWLFSRVAWPTSAAAVFCLLLRYHCTGTRTSHHRALTAT
jgi:hypothetical protein